MAKKQKRDKKAQKAKAKTNKAKAKAEKAEAKHSKRELYPKRIRPGMKKKDKNVPEVKKTRVQKSGPKYTFGDSKVININGKRVTVYQVVAQKSFGKGRNYVKEGWKGGWIEKPENLDMNSDCWVKPGAVVIGSARVRDNAVVCSGVTLSGKSLVMSNAVVIGKLHLVDCRVSGNCKLINKRPYRLTFRDKVYTGNNWMEV